MGWLLVSHFWGKKIAKFICVPLVLWHLLGLLCARYHYKCFVNISLSLLNSPKKVGWSLPILYIKQAVIGELHNISRLSSRTRSFNLAGMTPKPVLSDTLLCPGVPPGAHYSCLVEPGSVRAWTLLTGFTSVRRSAWYVLSVCVEWLMGSLCLLRSCPNGCVLEHHIPSVIHCRARESAQTCEDTVDSWGFSPQATVWGRFSIHSSSWVHLPGLQSGSSVSCHELSFPGAARVRPLHSSVPQPDPS